MKAKWSAFKVRPIMLSASYGRGEKNTGCGANDHLIINYNISKYMPSKKLFLGSLSHKIY